MSGKDSSPKSNLVDANFHSMEEVTEVARATGWQGQYHQLGKGPVTSRWWSLHLGQASLISHHLDNRVHARVIPPSGCVALVIVPPPYHLLVEGAVFGNNVVLVADAETNFVVPGEAHCDTLVLPKRLFEESSRALFPSLSTNGQQFKLIPCPHSGWSTLQAEIRNLLRDRSVTAEDISHLSCGFISLMAGSEPETSNRSTGRIARRAQEYIEDHYRDTIRMEDLCRYSGVSLRTLQRSFLVYFQVSPFDYIKARRLNAARQGLLAAASLHHTVSQIAIDSGFTHFGRFSVDYREHFGESPRETRGSALARIRGDGIGPLFRAASTSEAARKSSTLSDAGAGSRTFLPAWIHSR